MKWLTSRLTVRARLTLTYGLVFLVAGVALLAVTYVLMDASLDRQKIDASVIFDGKTGQQLPASARDFLSDLAVDPNVIAKALDAPSLTEQQRQSISDRLELAQRLQHDLKQRTLNSLLTRGGVAVGVVTVLGVWVGWLMAGRTLRPLTQITATARRVADRNLHERIGLSGPRDELRELADTFDDMLARLDASFDGQRRFVANASHELRTPLAVNRTLVEVAMGRPGAPPELVDLGATLLEVNARHERLIDGLLTLARSEQAVADPVAVDLAEVAARVHEQFGADARGAALSFDLGGAPAPTAGDPVLLERLAQNLVENAIRHNVAAGWVTVTTRSSADHAVLTVANTGPVVPAVEVAGLFEPFRRLTDRVGSAHGTGLGLSIVRSVARAHGGDVTAQPRAGGGLVVDVTLPLVR
ncbi:signal transduction histidine kinase [Asanoa ferruginea]|uniref:histidine kinase n=1 Tax=Asanoa ferruginea TaxID=53367 RepID=A0A3D9ZKB1_9ACTN|nr:HAMP domain-containing sensor histidine kinase [Asanoa ferruginea]REF96363.1 signal transduction histidine kinase [Asanoa ferruginea]GIF47009.1 sensor protein CutS [Asanoa ferruginea]